MATQSGLCDTCQMALSDGTPSGIKRHQATKSHVRIATLVKKLDRRYGDVRWRKKYHPDQVESYTAKRVAPLEQQLADARAALAR